MPNSKGVWTTQKSGTGTRTGIRNPELEPEPEPEPELGNGTGTGTGTGNGTGFGEINDCFKLGSMIHIKTPPPFSSLPRKMDDDTWNSFKVAEHSFQEPMPNSP